MVKQEYSSKWGCVESSFFSQSEDQLSLSDGEGIGFDVCSLQKSFAGLKRHNRLDAYGISLEVLDLFTAYQPAKAVCLFNRIASDDSWMQNLVVSGHCGQAQSACTTI